MVHYIYIGYKTISTQLTCDHSTNQRSFTLEHGLSTTPSVIHWHGHLLSWLYHLEISLEACFKYTTQKVGI